MFRKINYFSSPIFWDQKLGWSFAKRVANINAFLNETAPLKHIIDSRWHRLKTLIAHSNENVQLYHDHLEIFGIRPSEIQTEEDLRLIPAVKKNLFRKYGLEGSTASNISKKRIYQGITSGSTGEPFVYIRDLAFKNEKVVLGERIWRWANTDINSLKLYCSTESSRNLWPNMIFLHPHHIKEMKKEYIKIIREKKPKILFGYPLVTFELAWMLYQEGICDVKFNLAVFTGHKVSSGIRKFLKKEFDCEVFEYYGSMELGVLAVECEAHNGFHIQEENVIIDIVDQLNMPVEAGTVGKILITYLSNEAMPFIRYEIGDLGAFLKGECSCGRKSRRIVVEGRNNEGLFLNPNEECIYPGILRDILDPFFSYFQKYQLEQISLHSFDLRVIPTSIYSSSIQSDVVTKLKEVLGEDSIISISKVENIDSSPSGKFQYFISHLWENRFPEEMIKTPTLKEGMKVK